MSQTRPFTTLDPKKIKKDYPKTYKSITQWLEKCGPPEGNVITEEMVNAFLAVNPRFLYDYLDDMGICLAPNPMDIKELGRKEVEEQLFMNMIKEQETRL